MLVNNRIALTRGRTDQFKALLTYLQFSIRILFSSTLQELVFPVSLSLSAAKKKHFNYSHDVEFSPMTWTCKLNLDNKQQSQRTFRSNPHRHTQQIDCVTRTTKWSVKKTNYY